MTLPPPAGLVAPSFGDEAGSYGQRLDALLKLAELDMRREAQERAGAADLSWLDEPAQEAVEGEVL